MKKLFKILAVLLLAASASAQTTIVNGTVKDLSNAAVTSGQVTFSLRPGLDTTISGSARFVPNTITCSITGTGAVKALDGVSDCTVTNNTSLTPSGTSYTVCIQPGFVSPGSCFNFYALGTTTDISTIVPTPTTSPAYNFVNLHSAQTIDGAKTFTGNVSVGGTLQACNTINGVHWVCDSTAGADLGAKINTAAASGGIVMISPGIAATSITTALSLPASTDLYFPPGTFTTVGGHTISNVNVSIHGAGAGLTLLEPTNATGNVFTVTGGVFRLSGFEVVPGVNRTSGAFIEFQSVDYGVSDIRIADMYDGFVAQTSNASICQFKDIVVESKVPSTGTWHNLFRFGPIASGTITSCSLDNIHGSITTTANITGPLLDADAGVDGLKIIHWDANMSGSSTNTFPAMLVQKTGAAQAPSWMRIVNSYFEAGTAAPGVEIDNALDFGFDNSYSNASLIGVKITGGSGIRITNGGFTFNQNEGIKVTGGTDILIDGNDISDNAASGVNTFDGINFTTAATGDRITNNRIGKHILGVGSMRNGITIPAGASDNYIITGNVITGVGTSTISDGGTGTNKIVIDQTSNVQSFATAMTLNIAGGSTTSFGLHDTTPAAPTPNKFFRVNGGNLQIINSAFGAAIFNLDDLGNLAGLNSITVPQYKTSTNCAGVGTAASPSVASCGSAAAGQFSCATNATGATCRVNTTAVTANSEIFVFESDTAVTGTALGVTCNTSTTVVPTSRILASSVAGASFTINLGTVTTNPACFSYFIVN